MGNRNTWLSTFFLFGGLLLVQVFGDAFDEHLDLPAPFYITAVGLLLLVVAWLLRPLYKDVPIDAKLGNPFYVALFYAGGGAWLWLATGLMSIGLTGWLAFPGVVLLAGIVVAAAGGIWRWEMPAFIGLGIACFGGLICLIVGAVLVFPAGWAWLLLYLVGAVMTLPALVWATMWLSKRTTPPTPGPATSPKTGATRLPDGKVIVGRVARRLPQAHD